MTDTIVHHTRHPPLSRRTAPGALLKRRRRRSRRRDIITADAALHLLVANGIVFEHDRRRWLLSELDDREIEQIVVALAASEDAEDSGDAEDGGDNEPSVGTDDLECDGHVDDELTLGWANEGSQLGLFAKPEGDGNVDDEPDARDWPLPGDPASARNR
jgi:ribosomal protein L12E/L44/L45/RPP1/RPP2